MVIPTQGKLQTIIYITCYSQKRMYSHRLKKDIESLQVQSVLHHRNFNYLIKKYIKTKLPFGALSLGAG
jgi:hypothetical protein